MALFLTLGVTFVIAAILIFFISSHDQKLKKQREMDNYLNQKDGLSLDYRQFSKACVDICEILKLEITDFNEPIASEIVLRAKTDNPITQVEYLICCFHIPKNITLDDQRIFEISEQVISERLSKAIIMTTGRINHQIKASPELAPMEFIDGNKLLQMIEEYKINI